jgi:hypothetical protein
MKFSETKFKYRKMHQWADGHVYEVFEGDWNRITVHEIMYMNHEEFSPFYRYMRKKGNPPKLFTPA